MVASLVGDCFGWGPGAPTVSAFHLVHVKAGARLQRLGHEPAVVVAPHHHGAVIALGVGGHGHDRPPLTDGLEFGPCLAIIIGAGHAGGGQTTEHQDAVATLDRIINAVQGGNLAAGGPVFRGRQPVAPRLTAIGRPLVDDATFAVALGIDTQNGLAVLQQAGGGMTEVLPNFPIHHDLPFGLEGQIDQGDFRGRRGGGVEQNDDKQHATSFGLVRRMASSGGCMQAIRVWLSAIVTLFLVVSLFHVPLIQMWKRQKTSAVPVSTAPAPVSEEGPEVIPDEASNTGEEVVVVESDVVPAAEAVEPAEALEAPEENEAMALASSDARTVKIAMYPNMHFSVGRFVAQTGERLTVEFENDDPQAQPHNLVFTKPGRRMKVFTDMMRMGPKAVSSGYIPTKSRSVLKAGEDIVAISLLNPGETGSITFSAPDKPGAYPFACIYPGHQVSMYGVMHVVEDKDNAALPAEDADPGIPPGWGNAKNAANGEGAESASSSVSKEADTVVRMFMPDSGPASIAVATPEGVHYCWDAGAMQLRYAWTGAFLDPSNHFAGNGDALARVPGHIVWRRESVGVVNEDRSFLGYRMEQGRPVFRWTLNGDLVEERIRPVAGALLEQSRVMADGLEAVTVIEADPRLPRWYWSMDDTVRPTGHKPERLPSQGLVGRALPFREKAWKCGATASEAGTIDLWCRELNGTPVLSFDHRDATRIQAVVLGNNSLGVRGGTPSPMASAENFARDGWTRVTVRWDDQGTTVHAGEWAYRCASVPQGGIVIGGDAKNAFGGLIDEVRIWNRRLSDEDLDA